MKITIIGAGYVGLSNAILLAQHNEVVLLDIVKDRIDMINQKVSPIKDEEIIEYLSNCKLNLIATEEFDIAIRKSDYVIIATPTNYEVEKNYFDTTSVEKSIEKVLKIHPSTTIIIKSTIPVGYTNSIKEKYNCENIIFCPEFLREGKALYDNLHPSRIVIGSEVEQARKFVGLLKEGAIKEDIPVIYTKSTEAEAIKLFANTYLAMRISYINELDTYAELKGLSSQDIIKGISFDPRIGDFYNNPSFGYGGYCLPKDTKQLRVNFSDVPNEMINAIVKSNSLRKEHIVDMILKDNPKVVGIYKLEVKNGSDNYRNSAMCGIIRRLVKNNVKVVLYEPMLNVRYYDGAEIVLDLDKFKNISNIIVANRIYDEILDVSNKVYSRDLFKRD